MSIRVLLEGEYGLDGIFLLIKHDLITYFGHENSILFTYLMGEAINWNYLIFWITGFLD